MGVAPASIISCVHTVWIPTPVYLRPSIETAIIKSPDKGVEGVDVQVCDSSVWGVFQIFVRYHWRREWSVGTICSIVSARPVLKADTDLAIDWQRNLSFGQRGYHDLNGAAMRCRIQFLWVWRIGFVFGILGNPRIFDILPNLKDWALRTKAPFGKVT